MGDVGVPHSGQRSGLTRTSYPHVGQRPMERRRRLRVRMRSQINGNGAARIVSIHHGTATERYCITKDGRPLRSIRNSFDRQPSDKNRLCTYH